ncbi:MAG: Bax inhibitor-1/YccA family protein [Actinomycetes bacterium]
MSNPFLNDKAIATASQAGWAAPDPNSQVLGPARTPISDGPVSHWDARVMTVGGTITATGVLLVLLLASATAGWIASPNYAEGEYGVPGLAIVGILVGFVCAIVVHFKPLLSRVLGPIYAIAQGFFLGAISKGYESLYDGIVIQAVGATLGVFAVMLFLYRTQIIKVTDRFRRTVIMATLGLMVFYLISFVISLFGGSVPFLQSASLLGIGFSIFAAGLAALNLALDFDFIEKGAVQKLPKGMEWYAAFGLVITLVWLYLELLRLLSKLQQR